MAIIAAHEFISIDGVFESPTWTFEFGFDPKMAGKPSHGITADSDTILLRPHDARDVRAGVA